MSITAILLAAGYATRLYPLTADRPKALLPLGEGVILDDIYAQVAVCAPLATKVILITNSRFAKPFRQWARDRRADVVVIDDGTKTAQTRCGAIRDLALAMARGRAEGDLLVLGTDNLFRWDLGEFIIAAQRRRPHASVAFWKAPSRQAAVQFGVGILDADRRITGFVEKSPTPPSELVATCIYYFPEAMQSRIQEFLKEGRNADAPGYFITWLVERTAVYGVVMPGPWYDIGTIPAYEEVRNVWSKTPVPRTRVDVRQHTQGGV